MKLLSVDAFVVSTITEPLASLEGADLAEADPRARQPHRAAFKALWDRVNGGRAGGAYRWAQGPWVYGLVLGPGRGWSEPTVDAWWARLTGALPAYRAAR